MELTSTQREAAARMFGMRMDHRSGDDPIVAASQEYMAGVYMRTVADRADNIGSVRNGFYCDSAPKGRLDEADRNLEERMATMHCRTDAERARALKRLEFRRSQEKQFNDTLIARIRHDAQDSQSNRDASEKARVAAEQRILNQWRQK